MDKIVNAGIRITKECNFNCSYCNIKHSMKQNMTYKQVIESLNIIKDLGAKTLVLLGGEPTMHPYINEIVDYAENKLQLRCSLTTNAFKNTDKIIKLAKIGLTQIGVSIDTMVIKNSISPLKSKCGLELIEVLNSIRKELKKDFVIIDYIVVNKGNLNTVIEHVKQMTKKGVYSYFLPFHWGNSDAFEHRKDYSNNAIITDENINKFKRIMKELYNMKKNGYLIKNSYEFLLEAGKYIQNLNWKCSGLSELRVDCDGFMACCCDNLGEVNKKFTIFDLKDSCKLKAFLNERNSDANKCKGCLWPSSFEAQNIRDKEKIYDTLS